MADPKVILAAAGALIWRHGPAGPEIGVVHRSRYDDWSLPKGKPEPGEGLAVCALREVFEETGLQTFLSMPLGTTKYDTSVGPKTVHYWSARVDGDQQFVANAETDALLWLTPAEATQRLTYDHDASLVLRATATGLDTHTVLLVRHAHAGSRALWQGSDDDRPLDELGEKQAAALASTLACFGPTTIRSARPYRCVQTVDRLATSLDLPVITEELLDDEVAIARTDHSVMALRGWVRDEPCVVLCSQGGAIPAVVQALCNADDVSPSHARFPARKGSVWVLSIAGEQLIAANYVSSVISES